ncbi:MAG: hypothetical protein QM496_13990 [Verrucomicrobiota bacterium]
MDSLLYANIGRQTLSETLDGSKFSWPSFVVGGEVYFGLRFARRRDGKNRVVDLDVVDAYAAVGRWDVRPSTGETRLQIGADPQVNGSNTTAPIAADISAADLEIAINAVTDVGTTYPLASVVMDNGSYLVVFEGSADKVPIKAVENEFCPISLVQVIEYQKDTEWYHAIRFIQAPGAFADGAELIVPDEPFFVQVKPGSDIDGVKKNEVQALVRPSDFRGNFEIVRALQPSKPLSNADGVEQIQAALVPLADDGGLFEVSNPITDEAWIEFAGSMGGTGQDLLTINVPRAPGGDHWMSLDLSNAEMFALVREKNEVKVPFHIHILYRDPKDANVIRRWDYIDEITLLRSVYFTGMEVAANIDFLKPDKSSYVPTPVGSIVTGSQFYVSDFPKSVDVGAASFIHTHDLGTANGLVAVRLNSGNGDLLVLGTDYAVKFDNDNQLTVDLLPGGYFADPVVPVGDPTSFSRTAGGTIAALGALAITFETAGPRSALLAHTQAIATVDGLTDALAVMATDIAALKLLAPGGGLAAKVAGRVSYADWEFPDVFRLYPVLGDVVVPESGSFADVDMFDIFPGGLLPAVHDAATEDVVPLLVLGDLPDPADVYRGRVFENTGAVDIDIFGGGGHRSDVLRAGEFVACDGEIWYRVEVFTGESSYYPVSFNHTFFEIPITAKQLRIGRQFLSDFAFKVQMINSESSASCVFVAELGVGSQDSAPGTPGKNLKDVEWDLDTPALSHQVMIGREVGIHRFGSIIKNELTGGISFDSVLYGAVEAGASVPATADFWLRYRLIRFDTENSKPNPEGILGLAGPRAVLDSQKPDPNLGFASIN